MLPLEQLIVGPIVNDIFRTTCETGILMMTVPGSWSDERTFVQWASLATYPHVGNHNETEDVGDATTVDGVQSTVFRSITAGNVVQDPVVSREN